MFIPTVDLSVGRFILGLARPDVNLLIHILTNHNHLRKHQSKMKGGMTGNITPVCRFCNFSDETAWHLIWECEHFVLERTMIKLKDAKGVIILGGILDFAKTYMSDLFDPNGSLGLLTSKV